MGPTPGISKELFVLRSKAAEMNFDGQQQAIKRMRPLQHQSSQTHLEAPQSEISSPAIVTPTLFKTDIDVVPFFDKDDHRVPFFDRDGPREVFGDHQLPVSEQSTLFDYAANQTRPQVKSFVPIPFESKLQTINTTSGRVSPPVEQAAVKRRSAVNGWILPQSMSVKQQSTTKTVALAPTRGFVPPRQEQLSSRPSLLQEDLFDKGFF
jgi:hypothetical protein